MSTNNFLVALLCIILLPVFSFGEETTSNSKIYAEITELKGFSNYEYNFDISLPYVDEVIQLLQNPKLSEQCLSLSNGLSIQSIEKETFEQLGLAKLIFSGVETDPLGDTRFTVKVTYSLEGELKDSETLRLCSSEVEIFH